LTAYRLMHYLYLMSTHYEHTADGTTCDLGPSEHLSDPDNVCGHGYNIREVYDN